MKNIIKEKTSNFTLKFIAYNSQFTICAATDPADEFHSPYVYCANNPVMLVDPDGEEVRDAEVKNLDTYKAFRNTQFGIAFYNLYATGKYNKEIVEFKRVQITGNLRAADGGAASGYYYKGKFINGVAPKGKTQYHKIFINEERLYDKIDIPIKFMNSVDSFLHESHHIFDFSNRGKTSDTMLKKAAMVEERAGALLDVSKMKNFNFNLDSCKKITSDFSIN